MFDTASVATRDRLTIAALHGTAWRHATDRGNITDAIADLQQIAGGRTDLLAETAGITAGFWSAPPGAHIGTELLLSGLCIYAGADLTMLDRYFDLGRQRGLAANRPVHGTDIWHRPWETASDQT